MGTRGFPVRVVVSERNDVVRQPIPPHVAELRDAFYRHAHIVTANTLHSVRNLRGLVPGVAATWMPNHYRFQLKKKETVPKVLGMLCRLEKQKNVDIVIEAFAASTLRSFGWRLLIYGEGQLRQNLEHQIKSLAMENSVEIRSFEKQEQRALDSLGILVSASDYEGSSNSIHEAVAAGVIPLVSQEVEEISSVLVGERKSKLTFPLTVPDLTKTMETLPDLILNYDILVAEVQGDFKRYWSLSDAVRRELMPSLTHAQQVSLTNHSDAFRMPA
jgi:glycosyltransferase involved in cell wall biosynthesis